MLVLVEVKTVKENIYGWRRLFSFKSKSLENIKMPVYIVRVQCDVELIWS